MPSFCFLSTDLNGTLVHAHTMQEMIRVGFPEEPQRFETASRAFALQTDGKLSISETFRIAGEQTRGLPLRVAIDFALNRMSFVDGYPEFAAFLKEHQIPTAIVSTGYSVTLYAMRHGTPAPQFMSQGNRLIFAAKDGQVIPEDELENLVRRYIENPSLRSDRIFGSIHATGEVALGIHDEGDKARIVLTMAQGLGIPSSRTMHMGDTMGDSLGILAIAKAGGLGVAFNYNHALEAFLRQEGKRELESGHILLIDPKGPKSNLKNVLPCVEALRKN
jgi:phosphoserine phosphatase